MRPAVETTQLGFSNRLGAAALGAIFALSLAVGCSSHASDNPDARPPRPPDGGSEYWDVTTVAEGGIGLHTKLAIKDDGLAAIAYYASWAREEGVCDELDDPPVKMIWDMYYAEETTTDFVVELVKDLLVLGVPPGLDLEIAPDGTPTIVAMTGEPVVQIKYCGSNDVGVYTRTSPGTWDVEVAVADSGEAGTGEPASDYGYVVGHWPTLTYDPNGNAAIAYRDVHAGAMQGDDNRRADLELAWQTGGWQHIPVDWGHGAGEYSTMLFDSTGRPIIVYANNVEESIENPLGLWATRSSDSGETWEKVRFIPLATLDGPDAVIDPADDTLYVVYYHGGQGVPMLLKLEDEGQFASFGDGWTSSAFGDPRYDEGYNPSIAISPDGQIAVAYYRCTHAAGGLGNCDPTEDGLVFAWEDNGGWETEIVDPGEDLGQCGNFPSLAFDGDGVAVIAYQCQRMEGEELVDQVRFARRDPL